MEQSLIAYYRSREQAERAAAERAACEQARGIHLALAARYAALIRGNPLSVVTAPNAPAPTAASSSTDEPPPLSQRAG